MVASFSQRLSQNLCRAACGHFDRRLGWQRAFIGNIGELVSVVWNGRSHAPTPAFLHRVHRGSDMRQGKIVGGVFTATAAVLLAGCVPPSAVRPPVTQGQTTVKSIMQDTDGYVSREFSPYELSAEVRNDVVNMDASPAGFGRIVVEGQTINKKIGGTDVSQFDYHWVVENQGNGMMRSVVTMSANGIPVNLALNLNYRNIFNLRSQLVRLDQTYAPRIIETNAISHFDAVSSGRNQLDYEFTETYEGQPRGSVDSQTKCTMGAAFSAADLNPKIAGSARSLDCDFINRNGVTTSRSHYAYLDKYGIAMLLDRENATAHITFKVTDFTVN
ncbi:hypothetical protein IHE49_08945 [Rhodanobacter sp. 7MK24]|uniref:hypothetical protein n=1 Tax=Rhodanobacter sp. 7MK24 TaxID=2775922 RepID=UPI0017800B22|nr:hypothetical protein [Rhodanobacter sp. 7MK24]MBD8880609.1 hypothetical protein [Rhodanobacter sp. 7MK24]